MFGLVGRLRRTAGQDGIRNPGSKRACRHRVPGGPTECRGFLDRQIAPPPCARASLGHGAERWPCANLVQVAAAMGAAARVRSYRWPLTISFQAMRAVLLASATAASLAGLRLSNWASQGEGCVRPRLT